MLSTHFTNYVDWVVSRLRITDYSEERRHHLHPPYSSVQFMESITMLNDPGMGGGIRSTADMFINYLNSENKNIVMLIEYAKKLGNGAVFKRLGFLLERFASEEQAAIDDCKSQLTKGNVKLDPKLPAEKLVTRWRLWVPLNWSEVK